MPERVDARDVLDVNALIEKPIKVKVVGVFERSGPNSWDDYIFRRLALGELELPRGTDVQLERRGSDLRWRTEGRVQRGRFVPSAAEEARLAEGVTERQLLLEHLRLTQSDAGIGVEAVLVRTIKGGG